MAARSLTATIAVTDSNRRSRLAVPRYPESSVKSASAIVISLSTVVLHRGAIAGGPAHRRRRRRARPDARWRGDRGRPGSRPPAAYQSVVVADDVGVESVGRCRGDDQRQISAIFVMAARSGTDPTTSIPSAPRSLIAPIALWSIRGPLCPFAGWTALVMSVLSPASSRISAALSTTSTSSGLRKSETRTPTVIERTADKERAAKLVGIPSSAAACWTRRRLSSLTMGSPRITKDTSDFETSARSATSGSWVGASGPAASAT